MLIESNRNGLQINICSVTIKNNKGYNETYLPYNCEDFQQICKAHLLEGDCNCYKMNF